MFHPQQPDGPDPSTPQAGYGGGSYQLCGVVQVHMHDGDGDGLGTGLAGFTSVYCTHSLRLSQRTESQSLEKS